MSASMAADDHPCFIIFFISIIPTILKCILKCKISYTCSTLSAIPANSVIIQLYVPLVLFKFTV